MTVATDLARGGAIRRHFVKLDGYEPILWEAAPDMPFPAGWSRSGLACLRAPTEMGTELDVAKMRGGFSGMTLELDDIRDVDGLSRFGRLFAPARWDGAFHTRLLAGVAAWDQVDATDVTIPVDSTDGFPVSGTAYIRHETFTYTGTTPTSFTGCTRGRYPCVGASYAATYPRPMGNESRDRAPVALVPYSWLGRRVALYVTTWDAEQVDWRPENESVLLWCGRISDRIVQDGASRVWRLSCTSILDDLERTVGRDMRKGQLSQVINLNGVSKRGRTFKVNQHRFADINNDGTFTIPASTYQTPAALLNAIAIELNDDFNYSLRGAAVRNSLQWTPRIEDGKAILSVQTKAGTAADVHCNLEPLYDDVICHALVAVGLAKNRDSVFHFVATTTPGDVASGEYYTAYHPLHNEVNGNHLFCNALSTLWPDQGDYGTPRGALRIEKCVYDPFHGAKKDYIAYYSARAASSAAVTSALGVPYDAFVGQKASDKPVVIEQIFVPQWKDDSDDEYGPFELILRMMLSTGEPGYNGVYDLLPRECGLGIQEDLIDIDTFLDADAIAIMTGLGQRVCYPIPEPTELWEIVERECILFGYAVCWRAGKLTLSRVISPDEGNWTVTIDDDNTWPEDGTIDVEAAIETVVNQYRCKMGYDPLTGKADGEIIITDADSADSLVTCEVEIDHPGVYNDPSTATDLTALVEMLLLGRELRYPSLTCEVGLLSTLEDRVFGGDLVRFVSSRVNDPNGTGVRAVECLATVLSVSWDRDRLIGYKGAAKLMLHAAYQRSGYPWAAAAFVDFSAPGGGWDPVNYRLTLVPRQWGRPLDPKDGNAFCDGDRVLIQEASPADPAAPRISPTRTVVGDFNSATDELTLDGPVTCTDYIEPQGIDDPNWNMGDEFAWSSSADGTTVVVGDTEDPSGGFSEVGAVEVFERDPGTGDLAHEDTLVPADAHGWQWFGYSVSLHGDTMAIGSPQDKTLANNAGAVYIFTRDALGVWSEHCKIYSSDWAVWQYFGESVALEGNLLAVGTSMWTDGVNADGAVYIFTEAAGVWTEQAKIITATAEGLGKWVTNRDGTILAGAPYMTVGVDANAGGVCVIKDVGGWGVVATLVASDSVANGTFGECVAMAPSGAVCAIASHGAWDLGSVYVFRQTGGVWAQEQKLQAANGALNDNFGYSLAMLDETLVCGYNARKPDPAAHFGGFCIFQYSAAVWTETQELWDDTDILGWGGVPPGIGFDHSCIGIYDYGVFLGGAGAGIYFRVALELTSEHVVISADHPDATADQRFRNTYQAESATGLLAGGLPQRYG